MTLTHVGGHLTRLGTRNDVIVQKEFVSDLEKADWQSKPKLSKYIDAVNENCVNTMMPKWESRLGGAQQFMSTHCFTMAESGRVDPTVQALLQNINVVHK